MFDKILKTGWFIVVVFLAATFFLVLKNVRDRAAYKVEKEAFEQKLTAGEARITDLEGTEATAKADAKKYQEAADAEAAKRKADNEAWAKKAAVDNAAWQKKVGAMTADAVVEDIRAKLKLPAEDVYKNSFGVQFSLLGAKTNLLRLGDADYFTLTEKPKYIADIQSLGRENADLRAANKKQGEALAACDGIKDENKKIKADYAGILKTSENQAKWLRVTIPAGTVAIIVLVLKILKVF